MIEKIRSIDDQHPAEVMKKEVQVMSEGATNNGNIETEIVATEYASQASNMWSQKISKIYKIKREREYDFLYGYVVKGCVLQSKSVPNMYQ